jgi:hypothetical protein
MGSIPSLRAHPSELIEKLCRMSERIFLDSGALFLDGTGREKTEVHGLLEAAGSAPVSVRDASCAKEEPDDADKALRTTSLIHLLRTRHRERKSAVTRSIHAL